MGRPRKRSPIAEAIAAAAAGRNLYDFPATPHPGAPRAQPVVLVAEVPSAPLSINRTAGKHYGSTQRHKHEWQELGERLAVEYAAALEPFRGFRVRLTVALPVSRPGQCDAGNFVSGVSVKALQDGLTRSGRLVPDDTATWLDTCVVFWRGGPSGAELRVKVEAAQPAEDPTAWTG